MSSGVSTLAQPEHQIEAFARCDGFDLVLELARVNHGEAGALRTTSRYSPSSDPPQIKLRSEPSKSVHAEWEVLRF